MAAVTLILPARNEEATIGETLDRLQRTAGLGIAVRYLVADDHSSDQTAAVAADHGASVSRATRWGLGAALRHACHLADTEWVLFLTADGAENPQDIVRMVSWLRGGVDAVVGDRWGEAAVTGYSVPKRLLNRLGNVLISSAMRSRYADWTNLCKAYKRRPLLTLDWSDDFRCVVEIPMRYLQRFPRMVVVATDWTERKAGRSTFSWHRPLQQFEAFCRVSRED